MTDYNQEQWTVTEGADVVGSDGEKVGEVVNAYPDYVVVKKGFFFPSDYYIPSSAIANVDEGHVYLNVTKDEAMNQDPSWENEPVGTTTTTGYDDMAATTTGAAYSTDSDITTSTTSTGLGGTIADTGSQETVTTASSSLEVDEEPYVHQQDTPQTHTADGDTIRVALAEEELTARTREVERGSVEVHKEVIAEEQTLEVPVTEERVNVERRVVDRAVTVDDDVFQEGTIEVPIRGEEVEVHKEARVTEEVRIDKDRIQSTERVTDTVRHEEVRIDDSTGAARTTRPVAQEVEETVITETTITDSDGDTASGNRNQGGGNPI